MSKMTVKGQVTIPKRLRERLGLAPGAEVDFELTEDGRVFLKAVCHSAENRFSRLRGSARPSLTTDELIALTRGEDAP